MKIAFVNDSCQRLGVQYISAVLKESGHRVELFVDPLLFDDEFVTVRTLNKIFDYKKKIAKELRKYKPDLIGFSVVTGFYQWALTMARMIKKEMDVPIIFGGIHPTSVPERVIANDAVDMVCVGEGEYPMLELVNSLEKGSIDYSIKNIWFKKDGRLIQNEIRPLIEDLDSLPMPDTDLYYSASPHFKMVYYIATTRGCPYSCSYCCSSYLHELYRGKGKHVRKRSVTSVIDELTAAKGKYKIPMVFFIDDCFAQDIDWLREFSVAYRQKIGIPFSCEMHPFDVSSASLKYLKEAGCGEIELGIQSWDEGIREKVFNRRISNAVMEQAMSLVKKEKINLVTGDLLGYPGQKDEHVLKSIACYSRIKPTRSYIFILKYYPNTLVTRKAVEAGFINNDDYAKILEGYYGKYLTKDGEMTDETILRFLILFLLIRILPNRAINYIIRKRLYRYFPTVISPVAVSVMSNLISGSMESHLNRRSAYFRYRHFLFNAS